MKGRPCGAVCLTALRRCRSCPLTLRDQHGAQHTVLLNSWANGTGRADGARQKSRVYVLEKMASVLAAHRVGEGAAVGLCLDAAGRMFLAINTDQVRPKLYVWYLSKAATTETTAPQAGP